MSAQDVPGKPARPTVIGGREQVGVEWSAPSNTGSPITGYEVQYRIRDIGDFADAGHSGTTTTAIITGLQRGKYYQVQVRARNADGAGPWSQSGEARTRPNRAPELDENTLPHSFSVDEGKSPGQAVGSAYTATDPDGDPVSYTLAGEDAGVLAIASTTGQIQVGDGHTLDYESPADKNRDNTYNVEIVAADAYAGTDKLAVTISVNNIDEPGTLILSTTTPSVGTVLTAVLSDPDGSVTNQAWRWQRADDAGSPAWVDISGADSDSYTVAAADQSKLLRAVVSYRDGHGSGKSAESAASAVRASNRAPTFTSATTSRSVLENTAAGQPVGDPLIVKDPDRDPLSVSLSGDSGPFDFDKSGAGATTTVQLRVSATADLDYEVRSSYMVVVSAVDARGGSAAITVAVRVIDVAEAPARPDAPSVTGGVGRLSVSWNAPANTGPEISGYEVQFRIKDFGEFADAGHSGTTTTAVITGLQRGKFYQVQVRARNAEGTGPWSQSGEAKTQANRAPTFPSATTSRSVLENAAAGLPVGAPLIVTDLDHDPLSVSLSGDSGLFDFDKSGAGATTTVQLRVSTSAGLDYEVRPSYTLVVSAVDGRGGSAAITVAVRVINIDEPGTLLLSTTTPSVGTVLTASLSDPDGNVTNQAWRWQRADDAGSPAWVDISGADSDSYTVAAADQSKLLRAVVSYRDGHGAGKSAESAAAAVRASNRAPTFPSATTSRSVLENTAAGQPVGDPLIVTDPDRDPLTVSLSGDSNPFDFDKSGEGATTTVQLRVSTSAGLDYEVRPSYTLVVSAVDGRGGSAAITVAVRVINIDEPGTLILSTTTPSVGSDLTAVLSDPDGSVTNQAWRWQRADDAGSPAWVDISGADSDSYTVAAADQSKLLRAVVSYRDGHGSGKSAESAASAVRASNRAPTFTSATTSRSVLENTAAGQPVGDPLIVKDPDRDPLSVSLSGASAPFDFDKSGAGATTTVQLRVSTTADLDYEVRSSYIVVVSAVDARGGSAAITVAVSVIDVAEAPSRPDTPSVTGGVGRLSVSWNAPANTGPEISGYEVQFRIKDFGEFADAGHSGTTTTAVITGLQRGKFYQVQVRARNAEGTGPWSQSGEAKTQANRAPTFPSATTSRSVLENAAAGLPVGAPLIVTDLDHDPLSVSLSGDSGLFDFDKSGAGATTTVQLRVSTSAGLDYEVRPSYTLVVSAVDGRGGSAAITVAVRVINIDEPGTLLLSTTTPSVGTVLTASLSDPDGNVTNQAWRWQRADDAGSPAWVDISGADSDSYTVAAADQSKLLRAVVSYRDGHGAGKSAESAALTVRASNRAPTFPSATTSRSVLENAAAGQPVGDPLIVTDLDHDPLTVSLSGDSNPFDFDKSGEGATTTVQLRVSTSAGLDYEVRPSYTLVVSAVDGRGGSAAITVTIGVIDVAEAPSRPDTPSVTGGVGSLSVSWDAPANTGPEISGYEVQFRIKDFGEFADAGHSGTTTTAIITGLQRGKLYQVQVRARNAEGTGPWSQSGEARTRPNRAPELDEHTLPDSFSVDEGKLSGQAIGSAYTATDPDGDTVSHTLAGEDAGVLAIASTTGQIQVGEGHTLDYEHPADKNRDNTYNIEIVAADAYAGTDKLAVTISVNNVDEPGTLILSTATPSVGEELTAVLSDPDGSVVNEVWRWQRAQDSDSLDWVDISGAASDSYTVDDVDRGKLLRVMVSYTDGQGAGKSAESAALTVGASNRAPTFPSDTTSRSVLENTAAGQPVGDPLIVTDPDRDPLTVSLSGASAPFDFDKSGAGATTKIQLRVSASADLDYEVRSSYIVVVSAVDGRGGSAAITVAVSVIDVAEAPSRPDTPSVTGGVGSLRGCLQSLELVLNLMNEPQIVPQRPDGRTVGDPRPPTPTSQARRPAPYSGPAGGSERHPVFASERMPLADGPARSASLADPVQILPQLDHRWNVGTSQ